MTGLNTGLSMSAACARKYTCWIRACRLVFAWGVRAFLFAQTALRTCVVSTSRITVADATLGEI